jgi:hypothetical protein
MDMSTLKQRLQQIAVEVSRKARSQGGDDRRRENQRPPSNSTSMRPDSNSGSGSPFMGMQSSSQHQPMPASGRGQIVNPDDINPMANSNSSGIPNMSVGNMNMAGNMGSGGYHTQRPMGNDILSNNRGSNSTSSSGVMPSGGQNRNDPEWKIRIRHKQQRLLLLHHSAKCPHEDGRCNVTPHCADMKRLWKHMEGCKDNQCRVSHCFSSRAILSHYRKCKDPACPACGPVRETVRKSQNRNSSNAGASMRSTSNSTAMMNGMPNNSRLGSGSAQTSQQHSMMSSTDITSQRAGSFSSSTMGQSFPQSQSQASQSSMPPPTNGPAGNAGMQFASVQSSGAPQQQYRSMSSSGQAASSVQPTGMYRSVDTQNARDTSIGGGKDLSVPAPRPPSGGVQGSDSNQNSSARRNDSEWQKVRHKQQRLLLLRHASRCQYTGKCPVTPHCASMKTLWEHIAHCKNQQCAVAHCMSSRYVLSHYRRCKDARCPACAPVRETIRKSHEKERGRGQPSNDASAFDMDKQPRGNDALSAGLDPTPIGPIDSSTSPDYMPASKRTKTEHTRSSAASASQVPSRSTAGGSQPDPALCRPVVSEPTRSSAVQSAKLPSADSHPSGSKAQVVKAEAKDDVKSQASATKTSEDRSLLNSFTVEQLTTHLAALNRAAQLPPAKLKQKGTEVLKGLQTHQHGWVFNCPVDPVELGLPDYFEVIKKPMDLGTIQKKLDAGVYHDIEDFQGDVNLTFDNAMAYNESGTVVYDMAKELKIKFEADHKKLVAQLDAEDRERRQNERACVVCGCEKRLFEPPVFFCNGFNCSSKRIRRNSHFYIGGNNQYFWCNQCFNELDEKSPIELIDLTISKTDLKKKKNDEVHEESWVQCDVCNRWIHQICGLFNTRQNKEHHSEYCCPLCLLEKRKKNPVTPPPSPPGAADLPRTKLSEFLEKDLSTRIDKKKRRMAEDKARIEVGFLSSKCYLRSPFC